MASSSTSSPTTTDRRPSFTRAGSSSPSVSMDSREKEEILAAARKKLKNYRKSKKSKRSSSTAATSVNGSISSLLSTTSSSSSTHSLTNSNATTSPNARKEHHRKRSSLGGSVSGMNAFKMPSGGPTPLATHARGPSTSGGGGGHGHKRSMSTKFTFPPPQMGTVPAEGGGRKPRPVSMGLYPSSSSSSSKPFGFPPGSPLAPHSSSTGASPALTSSGQTRRHSHRRSLSVSTKFDSLSMLLPPEVAAKLSTQGESSAGMASGDERFRALQALEGSRSTSSSTTAGRVGKGRPLSGLGVSGWDASALEEGGTAAGTGDVSRGRVVLPDLELLGEDERFESEPLPTFGFPPSPNAGGSSRTFNSKRDSFGKLLPSSSSMYLSLPPSSSSSSNGQASPGLSPALSTTSNGGGSPTLGGPMASPRFGPDGFPLGLGGIAEEEESDEGEGDEEGGQQQGERQVRRASQQVSLPPSRFGRFTGVSSPRLPTASSSTGWGLQRERAESAPDWTPKGPQEEGDRLRTFSLGAPTTTTTASFASPPTTSAGRFGSTTTMDGPSVDLSSSPSGPLSAPLSSAGKKQGADSRFRSFAFPRGPVVAPPPPAQTLPEPNEGEEEEDERTPSAPSSSTFEPFPSTFPSSTSAVGPLSSPTSPPASEKPTTASPPRTTKRALRPLTLSTASSSTFASPPPATSTAAGASRTPLRPLSLSLSSSTSSSISTTPNRPTSTFGSDSSFGAISPPPTSTPTGSSPRYGSLGYGRPRLSTSTSNLSISSTSSSAAGSPSVLGASEKRRSSISYGKSPSPGPAGPGSPLTPGRGKNSLAKCPSRPVSLLGQSTSSARRVLTDVGELEDEFEDDEEEGAGEGETSSGSPLSPEEDSSGRPPSVNDPFLHRHLESDSSPSDATGPSPSGPSAEDERTRLRVRALESERDALAEDVGGWRERCRALEDKLAEEKRVAVVERDLARERIRKLGERLASLTPDESATDHQSAQTRLVNEMRDQIFSLASSLARSEEMRKQAEEALREEVDVRERRIAEAVDEDRRSRPASTSSPMGLPQGNAPPTPPLVTSNSKSSSVSSSVSTNRSSFGAPPVPSKLAVVPSVTEEEEQGRTYDSWKASPWGAGSGILEPTGEIDMANFGVVPPRPLEALAEETEDDDEHVHHPSFSSSTYDVSDDNVALGLNSSGELDPDGYDEDQPHNFLTPRHGDDDDGDLDPTTPVQHRSPAMSSQASMSSAPLPTPTQEPAPRHSKRHSLQRTWVMPTGPVVASPEEPQVAIIPPVQLDFPEEDEDVRPFGTWVVPPSPFFNSEEEGEARFATNTFPSALYVAPSPAAPLTGGYNDPPSNLFDPRLGSGPSSARPHYSNRSVSAPQARAPPVSRSAVYHAANPSITSTAMSESPSLFSLTSLTSTIGSYVLPPTKGATAAAAGVLCSVVPEDEQSVGQSSGQWVVRPHDSPASVGRSTASLPRSQSAGSVRSSFYKGPAKRYVDPVNQPPPYATPGLDFRATCCGDDWSAIIDL